MEKLSHSESSSLSLPVAKTESLRPITLKMIIMNASTKSMTKSQENANGRNSKAEPLHKSTGGSSKTKPLQKNNGGNSKVTSQENISEGNSNAAKQENASEVKSDTSPQLEASGGTSNAEQYIHASESQNNDACADQNIDKSQLNISDVNNQVKPQKSESGGNIKVKQQENARAGYRNASSQQNVSKWKNNATTQENPRGGNSNAKTQANISGRNSMTLVQANTSGGNSMIQTQEKDRVGDCNAETQENPSGGNSVTLALENASGGNSKVQTQENTTGGSDMVGTIHNSSGKGCMVAVSQIETEHERRRHIIKRVIDQTHPDIVLFQELKWMGFTRKSWKKYSIPYYYTYKGHHEASILYDSNCIVAKDTSASEFDTLYGWLQQKGFPDDFIPRMCIAHVTSTKSSAINFMVISWYGRSNERGSRHNRVPMKEQKKIEYFRCLMEFVKHIKEKYKLPILIAGDFNVAIELIESFVQPPFRLCKYEPSKRRIWAGVVDYYIISKEMRANDIQRFDLETITTVLQPNDLFDHDPVTATIEFNPTVED